MTPRLRVLDTGVAGARWNVAVTAALAELHAAGLIGDTLRLHRYRECVLLGRSQPAAGSFDPATCERRGAEVARRVSGGGAVAMAPDVLAWDLVTARKWWRSLEEASMQLCWALAGKLGRFGIAAAFQAPGDIVAAGRKLAGTGGAYEGRTLLQQGSLLVEADPAEMAELLGRPALPVVTLAALAAPAPPMAEVAKVVAEAFAGVLGLTPMAETMSGAEMARAAALLAEGSVEALA